jgi:hypothetical protein
MTDTEVTRIPPRRSRGFALWQGKASRFNNGTVKSIDYGARQMTRLSSRLTDRIKGTEVLNRALRYNARHYEPVHKLLGELDGMASCPTGSPVGHWSGRPTPRRVYRRMCR